MKHNRYQKARDSAVDMNLAKVFIIVFMTVAVSGLDSLLSAVH